MTSRSASCDETTGAVLRVDDTFGAGSGRRPKVVGARAYRPPKAVTSQAYRPPEALAELVRLRDGHCRFPGGHIAARFCDLDHVRPWPAGPTDATNLVCLCRRHHRTKQQPRWQVRMCADATVTWTDPTGRRRTTRPVDHLGVTTPRPDHTLRVLDPAPLGPPPPFRQLTDDLGNRWYDDGFSVLEDVLDLWTRQYHAGLLDDPGDPVLELDLSVLELGRPRRQHGPRVYGPPPF